MKFPLTTKLSGVSYGDCQDNIKQFGYGNIDYRINDVGGYLAYDLVDEKYEEFLDVVRLGHRGRLIEAYKLMEAIVENFLTELEERFPES